ncbi:metallophosphoesterase [Myxococcota bacterium]|nr:metallophosphoesterase [Myxococcota bacterium]
MRHGEKKRLRPRFHDSTLWRVGRIVFAGLLALTVGLRALVAGATEAEASFPPENLTIAFIGDQGLKPSARAVLQLIADEGADAVIHAGDLGYSDHTAAWNAQIDVILGEQFPYFASIGNHDDDEWYGAGGYQEFLAARLKRIGIQWQGDLGVRSSLRWKGIFIVFTGPGITGPGDGFYDLYLRDQLASDASLWRISSWHKNMHLMQLGGKDDDTGWGVYEESRKGGSIVATGHEHSYSRTHLMSSFRNQTIADTSKTLVLARDDPETPSDEGRSFAFVSGLGGKSIRDQELQGPWWASAYTEDQGAEYGALFGIFHYQGDPSLARFYFKNIRGKVIDEFFVRSPGLGASATSGGEGQGGSDPASADSRQVGAQRPPE